MVRRTLNGAYDIVLPKHRADRPEWYDEHGWEKPRMAALVDSVRDRVQWTEIQDWQGRIVRRVTRAPMVFYVGAEEGELAAICALAGAEMVLFEPNPKAWPNIKAIWEANNLSQPACWAGFASDRVTVGKFMLDRFPDEADGQIVGDHGFKELYLERDNYPEITIDQVAATYAAPDIITFDVEGSEWQVLRGAEKTLREHRPTLFASIHPEFMFHQWGEYSADFRRWIKDFGYRETILDYQHELHCMYEPT